MEIEHKQPNIFNSQESEALIVELKQRVKVLSSFIHQLSSLGFYERNTKTGELTLNDFWLSCGYEPEDIQGGVWLELVHPDDFSKVAQLYSQEHHSGKFELEYRVRAKDGSYRWVLTKGNVVGRDEQGNPNHYIGIDVDMTERHEAEEQLRNQTEEAEQRALESDTLRMVGAVVAAQIEPSQAIVRILEQAVQVVPYEFATVYQIRNGSLVAVGSAASDGPRYDQTEVIESGDNGPHAQVLIDGQVLVFNKVDELFSVRTVQNTVIKSWMGVPLMIRGASTGMMCFESSWSEFFTDVHVRMALAFADHVAVAMENTRLYEEVRNLAITDELTGLLTRRWIQDFSGRLLEQAYRSAKDLSVLMIDVDHFKSVNDNLGHQSGDAVLKTVATICASALRAGDVLCRYGGEEFLAIMPNTKPDAAFQVAERLRESVMQTELDGYARQVTISIGVSSLGDRTVEGLAVLIGEADAALYQAKRQGRNRTVQSTGDQPRKTFRKISI